MGQRKTVVLVLLALGGAVAALGCSRDRPAPLQTNAPLATTKTPDGTDSDASLVSAADREEAVLRLDKAILAHGGSARLAKLQTMVLKARGTINNIVADQELQLRLPDHCRLTTIFDRDSGKDKMTIGYSPQAAWAFGKGKREDIKESSPLADLRNDLYMLWVRTLTPLKNQAFTLRPLPAMKFSGEPAQGIQINHKDRPAIFLYFDLKTNLLVRAVAPQWVEAGVIHRRELEFRDHKVTDDIMMPTVQIDLRNGERKNFWIEITYRFPERIEDKVFEQP